MIAEVQDDTARRQVGGSGCAQGGRIVAASTWPVSRWMPVLASVAATLLGSCSDRGALHDVEWQPANGPLRISVQYPRAGDTLRAGGDVYVYGSVGNRDAHVSVNGVRVPVRPNGAFLGVVPVSQVIEIAATLGEDRADLRIPLSLTEGKWFDSTRVWPRGVVHSALDTDIVIRATPDAADAVWLEFADGTTRALARRPYASTPGGPAVDEAVQEGGDNRAEWWTRIPARGLLGRAIVAARRQSDVVKIPLARLDTSAADDWARVVRRDDMTERGSVEARVHEAGAFDVALLPNTLLRILEERDGMARIALGDGTSAWVQKRDIEPDTSVAWPAPLEVGPVRVTSAPFGLVVTLSVSAPPVARVEMSPERIDVVLAKTVTTSANVTFEPGTETAIRSVVALASGDGSTTLRIEPRRSMIGYALDWRDGTLIVSLHSPSTSADPQSPLRGRVIAVDAGHPPFGTVGPTGFKEADATLLLARALESELQGRGARVVMTRKSAAPVSLEKRREIAERGGAEALVSIHVDAPPLGPDPQTYNGLRTLYFTEASADLAFAVHDATRGLPLLSDRLVHRRNLAVLRTRWMPAVLSEVGVLMVPEVEQSLRTARYREAYAARLADGLERYFARGSD